MDYKILKSTTVDCITTILISRPEALNALNTAFFVEMQSMLEQLEKEGKTKVAIITGDGKAFVAGADIAEMVNKNSEEAKEFSLVGQKTFLAIENAKFPVIAAINGFALGGGCELAMSCDFRIASTKAKFGQPEVNLGLIPGYAGTQRLARLVGLADALYLLMTAEMIDANEALRLKLVQKVVEPELLMEESLKIANLITSKGPEAVKKVKKVTRQGFTSSFSEG
jgi:enoyl-CoA hydratase